MRRDLQGAGPGRVWDGPAEIIINPERYWPYVFFDASEMCCRHCGEHFISTDLMEMLELLRGRFGPIVVSSGYRCEEYNRQVGGVKNSLHTRGLAVDIAARTPLARAKLIHMAHQFSGVGIYPTFVHLDLGLPRYWLGE